MTRPLHSELLRSHQDHTWCILNLILDLLLVTQYKTPINEVHYLAEVMVYV